jgi:predicted CoA-substrate-specific enzyme activase
MRNNGSHKILVTGRKTVNQVNLPSIPEVEATEQACRYLVPGIENFDYVISAGGETVLAYGLDKHGSINTVESGNKCASGTGSFLIQQMQRIGIPVEEAHRWFTEESFYPLSARCSVFCKSDCTHALNSGASKYEVVSGLFHMLAGKIKGLTTPFSGSRVVLVGGLARFEPLIKILSEQFDKLYVPHEADCFEAWGAAVAARDTSPLTIPDESRLFTSRDHSFHHLPALSTCEHLVQFETTLRGNASQGDRCILGLDVGSTTTKAVLVRRDDRAVLASVYLRTNGDPVGAARDCYQAVLDQLQGTGIVLEGVGTTGSGRRITGAHAMTGSVYNEIICHAAGTSFFDSNVDTILEIGGQDAKYTYLVDGVPTDYTMNEACAAGTGSFLEESAGDLLGLAMNKIAEEAMNAGHPVNFNDQCSAFISSDIATALQEGIATGDITAGLVYSVCMNYNNRVRGDRPLGKKLFMQGGVCYNRAVPVAMAALLNREIIVPPEPGLTGAFGCALEIIRRLENGLLDTGSWDLAELAARPMEQGKPFTCSDPDCDRRCRIEMIRVNGKSIPFGGACSKYDTTGSDQSREYSPAADLVTIRERMLYHDFANPKTRPGTGRGRIGISRSFYTGMLYPLYFNFWDQLGYEVVLPGEPTAEGLDRAQAEFCHPGMMAHGMFDYLLKKDCDYIFLPTVLHLPVDGCDCNNRTCIFVQGEASFIRAAFKESASPPLLVPLLDFQSHVDSVENEFIRCAIEAGSDEQKARFAFLYAMNKYRDFQATLRKKGEEFLEDLAEEPGRFAMVIQGRWYNALSSDANMGIPRKVASRGIPVIPFDALPVSVTNPDSRMHWGVGKIALAVAEFIQQHEQLFTLYITSFSCGPDSFILPQVRDIMGKKPSLTLELDSHTLDVGVDTRIEAALDIIRHYRKLGQHAPAEDEDFTPATTFHKGKEIWMRDSDGHEVHLKKAGVTFLFPSFGAFFTEALMAALQADGFNARIAAIPSTRVFNLGKEHSGCKECLPYTALAGSMMDYIQNVREDDERIVFFVVSDPSPCRTEQYQVGLENILTRNRVRNVAVYAMDSSEGFSGVGLGTILNGWKALCLADVYEQLYSSLLALAADRKRAMELLEYHRGLLLHNLAGQDSRSLNNRMKALVNDCNKLKMKSALEDAARVAVTGEVFVRSEQFSRGNIEQRLADMGFISRIAPAIDWHYYVDHMIMNNITNERQSPFTRLYIWLKHRITRAIEKRIKRVMGRCKFYREDPLKVEDILRASNRLLAKEVVGDMSLTIGIGMTDLLGDCCGLITVGPFACLQSRLSDSILKPNMNMGDMVRATDGKGLLLEKIDDMKMPLPYLSIEADGNPFPQLLEARLEVFALQARRMDRYLKQLRGVGSGR